MGVELGVDAIDFWSSTAMVLFTASTPSRTSVRTSAKPSRNLSAHPVEFRLDHAGELFDLRFVLHAFIVRGVGPGASWPAAIPAERVVLTAGARPLTSEV